MGIALAKLAEEDPTFRTYTDEETGQTIIAGMGELHLDIIVDRLLREFKVEANVGAPQVSYKETIKGEADVGYKYKKQSGGSGSSTQLSAVRFRRNISRLSMLVSRVQCRLVFWQAIRLLTYP